MSAPSLDITYTIKNSDGRTVADPYSFDTLEDLRFFLRQSLVFIAEDARDEELAKGFDKNYVQVVDNKRGKQLRLVEPFGKIQFIARADLREVLIYAFEAIDQRVKIVTGEYKKNQLVTMNGRPVATDRASFDSFLKTAVFSASDKIRFINTAPYARKLERFGISKGLNGIGRRKRKLRNAKKHEKLPVGTKILVPNGAYALAYRSIRGKFKANVFVALDFIVGSTNGINGGTYKTGRSRGSSYLYPSILIYASESGLKGLS